MIWVALFGAGGNALALEVRHLVDAGALDRHDVHAVRIEHHQRAQVDRLARELVLALVRVPAGVRHRERDVGLALVDQQQVGHRAVGGAGGRIEIRHVLGQHVSHAAAHRVVDAGGGAGRDENVDLLRDCAGRAARARRQSEQDQKPLHGSSLLMV